MALGRQGSAHPFVSLALNLGDLDEFDDDALSVSADKGKDVLGQLEDILVEDGNDLVQPFEPLGERSSRFRGSLLRLVHGFVSETLQLIDLVMYGK